MQASDMELIARVRNGDEVAFDAIYARHHRLLYAVALRITGDVGVAEEVLQDTFYSAWHSAAQFRPEASLVAWLVGLARNRAIDAVRSRTFKARRREQLFADEAAEIGAPDNAFERQLLHEVVRVALQALTPAQREVVAMAFFAGLTHAEIAARTSLPLGTVKTRMRTAFARLRRELAPAVS